MQKDELQKELEKFRDFVIKEARSNLTRNKKNVSKGLYESLKGNVKAMPNSFSMEFEMSDYGKFQDKGVKGKTSSTKAPNSPFKFGTGSGQKGGLTKGIKQWVAKKGIQFKDKKTGKYLSYNSTALLITRSIYNKGIKPSLFFTRPFELAYKKLPTDLIKIFGLEVEKLFKNTQYKNEKK